MTRRFLALAILLIALVAPSGTWGYDPQLPKGKGKLRDAAKAKREAAKEKPVALDADSTPSAEQISFFEKKIRPVLVDHCYACHSADGLAKSGKKSPGGGLMLDSRDGLRTGGDSGPTLVPGDASHSLLLKAIKHGDENLKMPPKQKLGDSVVADFDAWIKMGAPDPRTGGAKIAKNEIDIEKGRLFWSFQPPKKVAPPTIKNTAWPAGEIDRFVLAAQEAKALHPVADADPATLLRRVHLDLTGLPPSPAEVTAFVADPSPAAYSTVVDTLLASPHFGERWGRHWLDVARFGETSGKNVNFGYPHAWRYRDWVIAAFNADMPYDQFVRMQIAGDVLPAANEKQRAEGQIATGFLAIGPKDHTERNRKQFDADLVDEQIDAVSQAFMGLTIACARCHDHKFDPIPQRDYYAIAGIFASTDTCYGTFRLIQNANPSSLIKLPPESKQTFVGEKLTPQRREQMLRQIEDLKSERTTMQRDTGFQGNPRFIRLVQQIATLESQLSGYEADGTPIQFAMGVREKLRTVDSPIYARGEIEHPGERVPRGMLQVLPGSKQPIRAGSGRMEVAAWMASKTNPLTARVMVNRVWLHLFGRGLVATPDNFGAAGQAPSHPELLDALAVSFVENGWSIKSLIRQIVQSHAYRLGPTSDEDNLEADPDNIFLWRMMPRRLDAEVIRDSILAVSGQLDRKPPVASPLAKAGDGPPQMLQRSLTASDDRTRNRSVYMAIARNNAPEALALFDFAESSLVIGQRATTSVPAQALYLLNNSFVRQQSEAFADRLIDASLDDGERIDKAYLSAYGRLPSESERQAAIDFLAKYEKALGRQPLRRRTAWTALCQALFASTEFLFRN